MRYDPPVLLDRTGGDSASYKRTSHHKIPTMTTGSMPSTLASDSRLRARSKSPSRLQINPGLLEEFSLLRALRRAIRTWKSGLCLRPRIFQSFGVWVLPLEYVVFSDACFAWFNSGNMFYERLLANFKNFLRAVHSDPWRSSPFRRMEKCAQLMLRVAVSLRAVRTLNLDIISTSSPWWR